MTKPLSAGRYLVLTGCIAALTLAAFSVLVSALPERAFGSSYPMWSQAYELALAADSTTGSPDFEVLILGDSRAKAAYPAGELGGCVTALTMPGSSPFDLYLLARRYLEHHEVPKVVVLSVSPVHLQSSDLLWQRTARFGFATADEVREFVDVLHRVWMTVATARRSTFAAGSGSTVFAPHICTWPSCVSSSCCGGPSPIDASLSSSNALEVTFSSRGPHPRAGRTSRPTRTFSRYPPRTPSCGGLSISSSRPKGLRGRLVCASCCCRWRRRNLWRWAMPTKWKATSKTSLRTTQRS